MIIMVTDEDSGELWKGSSTHNTSRHLQVTLKADFVKDLGLDSLDAVELVVAFEDEFGELTVKVRFQFTHTYIQTNAHAHYLPAYLHVHICSNSYSYSYSYSNTQIYICTRSFAYI